MSNKKACVTSIIVVPTIRSKGVAFLYQTAANLLKDTVSHSYELQYVLKESYLVRVTEVNEIVKLII